MSETQSRAWHAFLRAQGEQNRTANHLSAMVSAGYRGGPSLNEAIVDYDRARVLASRRMEDWAAESELERIAEIAAAGGVRAWWEARHGGVVTRSELALLDDDEMEEHPFLQEVPC